MSMLWNRKVLFSFFAPALNFPHSSVLMLEQDPKLCATPFIEEIYPCRMFLSTEASKGMGALEKWKTSKKRGHRCARKTHTSQLVPPAFYAKHLRTYPDGAFVPLLCFDNISIVLTL